jgi:CRP-like cAMP-binding protein
MKVTATPPRRGNGRCPSSDEATRKADLPAYFAGLDQATMEAIVAAAIRRSYERDEIVFLEGDPCAGLYVVQAGWLKAIKISRDGREQILHLVGPGQAFCISEIALLTGCPNQATAVVLEPAMVWVVPRQATLRLLANHPDLIRIVTQNLATCAVHLVSLVEDLSLRPVEARLAHLLLENAPEGVLLRRRWTTQAELAAQLGTVPDVLHRALRGLEEEGLIRVARRQIRILDRPELETRAGLEHQSPPIDAVKYKV